MLDIIHISYIHNLAIHTRCFHAFKARVFETPRVPDALLASKRCNGALGEIWVFPWPFYVDIYANTKLKVLKL